MKLKNPLKLEGARPLSEKAIDALEHLSASRRDFLKTAGVMMISFGGAATGKAQSAINPSGNVDNAQVDSWIAIGADNSITVLAGKCDFGQGFRTVQLQLAAEELFVSMDRITLVLCKTGITPNQGYTAGSFSTWTQFGRGGLRVALDTARDALFQLASQYFDVPVSQLTVTDGVFSVIGGDPDYTVSYGQLIEGQRFNLTVNPNAVPNDPSTWKILGKPIPRVDIPAKVKGTFQYAQKVRVPGMLHGKVVRPPWLGAHVQSVDKGAVSGLPGNPEVVQINDWVGVVADTEWHALKAAEALAGKITWSAGETLPAQSDLYKFITQQPSRDAYAVNTGDVDKVMSTAAKTISAQYLYPFQMHGSLASSCAVADVRGGSGKTATVKAWSATQSVYDVRTFLSTLLSIPTANIEVMQVEGSGCYGGNGADPVTFDAAFLSQAVGKPVRVQYTRQDEMTAGEHYGHAMVSNQKVGLDANGSIIAWDNETFLMVHGEGPLAAFTFGGAPGPGNFIPGALAGFPTGQLVPTKTPNPPFGGLFWDFGNSVPPYCTGAVNGVNLGTGTVASQRCLTRLVDSQLWTSYLRSPDHIQNTWSNESFMDEIAASLKQDPVLYRLRYLTDQRLIGILNAVTQNAHWETRPSPRPGNPHSGVVTGRGVACVLYSGFDGYVAVVAEVSVNQDTGVITVTKVTAGLDTGPVINPDGLRNQMEGQVIQGISRALLEEVKFSNLGKGGVGGGAVTTNDWDSYTVFEFGDTIPEIDTVLINNLKVAPTGAGETIITLMPAAIGNAVFDATGVRLRQIPMTPANFLAAKAAQKV
ncbi:MAG TPA: molybdopterin cofactor-binding domain-containing protein [Bryobacteraceae bacterium]|nr:molybdopterin cofactor-binding domain-containing protein [Bryobacteraceae bacterium]